MSRPECDKEIERFKKTIEKLATSQNALTEKVSNLLDRFDRYLAEEEKKQRKELRVPI